ncbi:hypothetical protein [Streptomyces sp. NPDC004830]
MKAHESARCARPECRFSPLPTLNESGGLEVSEFCSPACREWLVNAVHIARCEPSPEVERQTKRIFLIKELLDLRDRADDVTFFTTPTEPLAVTHGG